jgi:hypothetical protein
MLSEGKCCGDSMDNSNRSTLWWSDGAAYNLYPPLRRKDMYKFMGNLGLSSFFAGVGTGYGFHQE